MKKLILVLTFLLLTFGELFSQSKVYTADIEGTIDLGLAPFIKRVIQNAETNLAEAVIFRINTFGGRVDAATQIKDAILDSKVMTIALVNKRAISAGALISLSCEKIVMVPGASMGASTVVDQTGAKQAEKAQSYMRSEFRATAEKTGRRTDIAEAMVDERVVIEGLVDSTQLLTLTSEEALKYGMADTVLSSIDELLIAYGLSDADVIELEENWGESVVRFLNNPIISSLLIMIGLVGMFTEIKSPGWGLPGTASIIALTLFFGTSYILELASVIEILLFIAGVALLLVEIFVVPGFGVFGVSGIILIVAGLFLGLLSDFKYIDWSIISVALVQLAGSFVLSIFLIYLLSRLLPRSQIWNKLILADNINSSSGYITSKPEYKKLVGKVGLALTDLRPSGTLIINKKRIDVVTDGEYIEAGTEVIVVRQSGSAVVVERTNKEE
ncbi:MAG: nodulation protein NfeD [Ignavibacteriae bacterium]|nr:nodulation protein NfeD [Ignavibacteriota bacterium]NOG98745.1 nodulation protein NfeD [Ignavibacteriota bacterium]